VICGFPTETKEHFEETLDLVRKYKFPVINISQFYSRPGTVAAKWKKVESKEVKRRSTALAKLFTTYPNYEHLKGTIQRVWIHDTKDEGKNNTDEVFMVAHTKSYAKVLIKREQELVGRQVIVKVVDIHKWHVYGEIIDRNPKPIHVKFEDHFKGMYKDNKNTNNSTTSNNRMAEIKKEQVDIHATINIPSSSIETEENQNIIKKEQIINSNINSKKSYNLSWQELFGMLLYMLSIYFLYLGMSKWIKFKF
jgi:hypothetical protein